MAVLKNVGFALFLAGAMVGANSVGLQDAASGVSINDDEDDDKHLLNDDEDDDKHFALNDDEDDEDLLNDDEDDDKHFALNDDEDDDKHAV